jgi:hypothetical protein
VRRQCRSARRRAPFARGEQCAISRAAAAVTRPRSNSSDVQRDRGSDAQAKNMRLITRPTVQFRCPSLRGFLLDIHSSHLGDPLTLAIWTPSNGGIDAQRAAAPAPGKLPKPFPLSRTLGFSLGLPPPRAAAVLAHPARSKASHHGRSEQHSPRSADRANVQTGIRLE